MNLDTSKATPSSRPALLAGDEKRSVLSGIRRLGLAPLVAALLLSLSLSIAANFFLFKSSLLDVPMRLGQGLISGTLLANLGLILVVLVLCLGLWGGARAVDLGLRRRDLWPAVLVTFVTWLCLNLVSIAAVLFSSQGIQQTSTFATAAATRNALGELIGQIFGNALYEEVLFRGILLVQIALWLQARSTEHVRRTVFFALLISQAIFALQHIPNRLAFDQWTSVAGAAADLSGLFVSGLFFAGVFQRTRNLLIAVGMHTLANLPTILVSGPDWVHPVVMAVAMLTLMAIGPRLSRE